MPHRYQPWPQAATQADPAVADRPVADPPVADPAVEADLAAVADPAALADPAAVADPAAEVADPAPEDPAPEQATSVRRRRFVLPVLGAVTIILGSFGIWATVHAASLRSQSAQQNAALVDSSATSAVRQQIDSAVQTIFSYNYANTGATRQAAQRLLTGPAIKQYNSLFALVQQQAPAEKLVLVTTVTSSGVELLTGNQARVLIFVNQQDTRSGTSQTSYSGAMLAVTAILQSGQWKIENIDTFT